MGREQIVQPKFSTPYTSDVLSILLTSVGVVPYSKNIHPRMVYSI